MECNSVRFFAPFETKGEVNKGARGKAYGVLLNCMASRAVYIDVSPDYSSQTLIMLLKRFVALRGYPEELYSDTGSQLVAASNELKGIIKGFDQEKLAKFGVDKVLTWEFAAPEGQWQNSCSEALIKSAKKAIRGEIGSQVLSFSELQTVRLEAAKLLNERPMDRHPTDPDDGAYLCPNHLLLGRASSRVPSGPFRQSDNPPHRFELVQKITDCFGMRWTRDFFPSYPVRQKWHVDKRNMMGGHIVIVQDSNQIRGKWKLARVSKIFPSDDGRVRRVEIEYKNAIPDEEANKYSGTPFICVERPVQRLAAICPADDIFTWK